MRLIKENLVGLVIWLVFVVTTQAGVTIGYINPFWELNLILIGLNMILAVSLNLINGITGQFSIGHAGFMAIGAYMAAVSTVKWHLPFLVSLGLGAIAAMLVGFLIGLPTLRLKGDYLAIATLGFGEIIRVLLLNFDYVGGARGFTGIPKMTNLFWVYLGVLITVLFVKNFANSTHGRACIAIREDEVAAESMGVNTTYYKVMAFAFGAMFAGVAGGLFAHNFYIVHPSSFTFMRSIDALIMVVLGGLGSISGSMAAAVFVTFISAALAGVPEIRMMIYALLLIILMIYRPKGLLGTSEISLSWRRGGVKGVTSSGQ